MDRNIIYININLFMAFDAINYIHSEYCVECMTMELLSHLFGYYTFKCSSYFRLLAIKYETNVDGNRSYQQHRLHIVRTFSITAVKFPGICKIYRCFRADRT